MADSSFVDFRRGLNPCARNLGLQIRVSAAWKRFMGVWYTLHYGLGVVAVLLSVTVASKPFVVAQDSNVYGVLAWILAIVTGLIGFLHPDQRGDRYRRAWSILASEVTRFKNDPSYTVNHMLGAYSRGEDIIHQTAAHDHPATQDSTRSTASGKPRAGAS